MNQLTLHINHPTSGFCLAGDALDVEIRAMHGQEHCDFEYVLQSFGEKNEVFITIDEKFIATAKLVNDNKATYVAKINLENISEGKHTLKALFPEDHYLKTAKVLESKQVDFIVDKSPPSIRSVFPSNIVKLEDANISNVVVEAEDVHSGIDVSKCAVTIDEMPCLKPSEKEKGIVFPVKIKSDNKTHKMNIVLTDLAGNNTEQELEFTISKIPQFVSSLIIETEDVGSGIDTVNCNATLDNNSLEKPAIHENGVVFPVGKELEAGPHKLKAIISDRAGNKTEYESEVIINSSTPFTSDVLVEADKSISDLDSQRCSVSIDSQAPLLPSHERRCLIFPLEMRLGDMGEGQHIIKVSIFDMAGNMTQYESEFSIHKKEAIDDQTLTTIPDIGENLIFPEEIRLDNEAQKPEATLSGKEIGKVENYAEFITEGESLISFMEIEQEEKAKAEEKSEEYDEIRFRENLINNLREKLVIDQQFLKEWLKSPDETAAKIGLSYTSEIGTFLPPSPPEEYIDYSLKFDSENVSKILDSLMTKVFTTLKNKIPSSLEKLKKEGVSMKDGKLTNSAKETINAILQDPIGTLESFGITLTDEERDAIFPPFPRKKAEALTSWISMVQSYR